MESISEWYNGLWKEIAGNDRVSRREILVLSYVHGADQGEPSLGYVGRSWTRRGASYWSRRISMTVVYVLTALIIGGGLLGFAPTVLFSHQYRFNAHLPLAVKIPILIVWSLPAIPAYLAMYRKLELYGFQRDRSQPMFSAKFLGVRYIIPLVLPFFPFMGGMLLAMGAVTLRRNFPGERAAREAQRMYWELQRTNAAAQKKPKKKIKRSSKK